MVFCPLLHAQKFLYYHTEYEPEVQPQILLLSLIPMIKISHTPGLDVVVFPKVEPVGGIFGGNLDL